MYPMQQDQAGVSSWALSWAPALGSSGNGKDVISDIKRLLGYLLAGDCLLSVVDCNGIRSVVLVLQLHIIAHHN